MKWLLSFHVASMTCRFLCVRLEPDTARWRRGTQVHPPPLWQLCQRHPEESATAAAVGEGASPQHTCEHRRLGLGDSWRLCLNCCQAEHGQTCECITQTYCQQNQHVLWLSLFCSWPVGAPSCVNVWSCNKVPLPRAWKFWLVSVNKVGNVS